MKNKKIHIMLYVLMFVSAASAQQVLQYERDQCNRPSPTSQELLVFWTNTAGQSACSLSAGHWGNSCYFSLFGDFVETQTFTQNQHCITDWTYDNFVTVTPKCGGTPGEEFHIIAHTCCQ